MKKFLKLMCCGIFALTSAFIFSACSQTPNTIVLEKLDSNMITLSYEEILYNGQYQTPSVVVAAEKSTISNNEYNVTYENNKNAGTARVVVSAKKGSHVLKGYAEKTFTIKRASINVNSANDLVNALESNNYHEINVTSDINISNNSLSELVIDSEETVKFTNTSSLTNNGNIVNNGSIYVKNYFGSGSIENNGNICTEVDNLNSLVAAFEFANQIKLTDNIVKDVEDEIYLVARTRDYKFTIDLNGNNIEVPVTFSNSYAVSGESYVSHCYDFGINATVINSSTEEATIGTSDYEYSYGVFLSGNHLMSLNLNNVQVYGQSFALVTNGSSQNFNANLTATDCAFISPTTNTPGMGAYLPAAYNYTFDKCTFIGATGYYTKNGIHKITNCEIHGEGSSENRNPQGEGGAPTGAAIDIDWGAWTSFAFDMSIYNSSLISKNNVAIQEYPNWNSNTQYNTAYRDKQLSILFSDSNPFGYAFKNGGKILETNDMAASISKSTLDKFDALENLYSNFVSDLDLTNPQNFNFVSGSEEYTKYTEFFAKAKEIFDGAKSFEFANYDISTSAIIDISNQCTTTFNDFNNLDYSKTLSALTRLFGLGNSSTFTDVAAEYVKDIDSLSANKIKYKGAIYAGETADTKGSIILPFAFENDLSTTVLAYVIINETGNVSIWVNNVQAVLEATSADNIVVEGNWARIYVKGRSELFEPKAYLDYANVTRQVEIKLYNGTKIYLGELTNGLEDTTPTLTIDSNLTLEDIEENNNVSWYSANNFISFPDIER